LGPRRGGWVVGGWMGQGLDQDTHAARADGKWEARSTAHWKINTKSVLLLLHFAANQTARSG
jgi:hypothetical protein